MEALKRSEGKRFFPLSIDLLIPRSPFEADIYFKIGDEMVLFRKRGLPLSRRRINIWREMGVKRIYLDTDDYRAYLEYLRGRLSTVMGDEHRPSEEKARFLYSLVGSFVEEMLVNPEDETIEKGQAFVKEAISYLQKGPRLGKRIIKMMSHDFATYIHLNNVFFLATTFSIHQKLPPKEVEKIGLASIFHDIGKERIDPKILQKPSRLDPGEWKEMKKHPLYSGESLKRAHLTDEEILRIVEEHHEAADGSGYPKGLKEEEIHPYSRLVQICDIFEALCGVRPYRRPFTPYEALKLMKTEMRRKVDWDLYKEFVRFLGPDYYSKLLKRR